MEVLPGDGAMTRAGQTQKAKSLSKRVSFAALAVSGFVAAVSLEDQPRKSEEERADDRLHQQAAGKSD
jgi:hypothetical protein